MQKHTQAPQQEIYQTNDIKVDSKLHAIARSYAICSTLRENLAPYMLWDYMREFVQHVDEIAPNQLDAIIFCCSPDLYEYTLESIKLLKRIEQAGDMQIFISENMTQYIEHHRQAMQSGCNGIFSILHVHGGLVGNKGMYTTIDNQKQDMQQMPAEVLFEAINHHLQSKPGVDLTFINTSCEGNIIIENLPPQQRLKSSLIVTFAEHGQNVTAVDTAACIANMLERTEKTNHSIAKCLLAMLVSKEERVGATIFGATKPGNFLDQSIQVDQNASVITKVDLDWLKELMAEGILPQTAKSSLNFIENKINESKSGQIRMLATALKELYDKNDPTAQSTYINGFTKMQSILLHEQRSNIDYRIINLIYVKNLYLIVNNIYQGNFQNLYNLNNKQYGLEAFYNKKTTEHILHDSNLWDQDCALFKTFFLSNLSDKILSVARASLIIKTVAINMVYEGKVQANSVGDLINQVIAQGTFNKSVKDQLNKLGMHYFNQIIEKDADQYSAAVLKALFINKNIIFTPDLKASHGAQIYIPNSALDSLMNRSLNRLHKMLQNGLLNEPQKKHTSKHTCYFLIYCSQIRQKCKRL